MFGKCEMKLLPRGLSFYINKKKLKLRIILFYTPSLYKLCLGLQQTENMAAGSTELVLLLDARMRMKATADGSVGQRNY